MALTTNYLPPRRHKHEVTLPLEAWDTQSSEIMSWLYHNVGPWQDGETWDLTFDNLHKEMVFEFYYEHNAIAFKLACT